MAGMSVDAFESQVISICSASPVVRNIVSQNLGLDWFNVRAYLVDESFVEIFYNQKTGKTAFAQIRDGRRIVGADNKKGWHWHPREDPTQHVPSDHVITFDEFLKEIEKTLG
jgi:hypothetical protein